MYTRTRLRWLFGLLGVLSVALVRAGELGASPESTSEETSSSQFTLREFRFTQPVYNVSIPENSVGRTYATQASGEERLGIHVPPNAAQLDIKYKIMAGDRDKFFKAEERLVGDFCFLSIRTRTGTSDVLNRERRDKYILEIRATATKRDGKNKIVLEAETIVIVKVLDTNDLNPLFYPIEYEKTVSEDTPLHQKILQVQAEDADLGRNGEIYYSFLEDTEQFAVHPMSGVITLTRPLKYTARSYYELTVLGNDRGAAFRSNTLQASRAKVRIWVKQVNLHSPEIYVQHLPHIVEHSNADIYAIVRVVDKDKGIHGEIKSLDIVDGDPDGHFRIRPAAQKGEFNIEVLRLLDRETTPQGYNLTLRAADKGIPPRQSYKSVPVHLADLNDNAPVFNQEIYEVKVPETAPINTPIIRLKVTDADEGKNAQVSLAIVGGNEGNEFRINPDTGMLYTAVKLDAEQKTFYALTVSAIDQGNTGTRKQSSAKVKINVVDTNDNDPIFDKPEETVWIDENEPTGTSVTKVIAKDRDSGENAYISYSIANLNDVPFEIDHFSGVVRTKTVLDYESMRREYILRIRASDWGLPYRRQTEMQLTIKVRDINDNRPQFEKVDCTGHVPRYVPIGSELITLSAIDFDRGNIISYRIVSGNEDGCFSLDSTSGVLSVSCDLNDIKVSEREVNVTATDTTHFADISRIHMHLVNAKRNLGSTGRLLSDETGAFDCRDTGVARRLTEVLAAGEKNNMGGRSAEEFGMMPSRYGQNIHVPEFIDFPIEIRVNESVLLGATLARLKARDRDLGYNGKLVYGISNGDDDSVFCLDPDTGELRVIGYLDRERESEYFLNVTVYDLGKPQKSSSRVLPITVLDVNDNAPKFEKTLASFRVTENALNGTAIFRANATDADLGDNAKITYSLVTDTRDFVVDPVTGVLTVAANLDREKQDLYELLVRATDNGGAKNSEIPSLYSDALVRVTIDDINDNAPLFSLNTYSVKVREDIPKGSVVAVVTASDPDVASGGEVVYSLVEADSDGAFKIDRQSGTIRTEKLLDFEERQVHNLTICAQDKGTPSLSSKTTVMVNIVDVNENIHAPQFDDFVLQGSVLENQPLGTEVMTIKAVDQDSPGDDSRVSYFIRGGDGIGLFSIDEKGVIRTLAVLDVETKPHYWLTVIAQDHGVIPLHTSVEVFIQILNENDNVPLTIEPVYYAAVPEDSLGGKIVVQLQAEDADLDPEQKLTYRIVSGNPEGFFFINSTSGLITTTARKLDRELQAEHILEVMVSDNGKPLSLSSTTRVVITVEDINDHAPKFEQSFYKVQIPASASMEQPLFQDVDRMEQSDSIDLDADPEIADAMLESDTWQTFSVADAISNGERVLRVLAFDDDIGKNGQLQYSIKSGRGKAKFKIHPSTGTVYAQKGFESGQEYDLLVRATDMGEPAKSHTCRVSIQVVAAPTTSEHPPVPKGDQHVEVTESDTVGFLVALVQASDPDNDTLWFDIVGGDPSEEFYIGRDNGNVLLARQLDRETKDKYNLTISITDTVHTVYSQLYVTVIDINDHRPEFTELLYRVQISEVVPAGTEILRLQATDADAHGKLLFSLHAAQHPSSINDFKLDSLTGALTLATSLDRETIAEHLLTVMVRDGGTPAKRNFARVLVTVYDHNDHSPQFSSQILEGKVFESAAVGSVVLRAYAIDRDHGDNAKITYSITSGNIGNVFSIDPQLGNIQVARELDLSAASEYTLQVKASDHGRPSLSVSVPAHIMLTMADNAPPRFLKQEMAAEIFEDQPLGSYVMHLEARSTSSLLYEIIEGNGENTFIISPSTGVIVTQDQLDYETTRFYNLTIQATNMASAKAICNVIVHVLDRNDNAPQFLQSFYEGVILESATINSLVLTNDSNPLVIKASDADSELNALLHYDIVESLPRKFFHIDASTGAIRTVRNLDHETNDHFVFHVKVSDLGKPRLSSDTIAKVKITINDVNDCAPIFAQNEYNVTLLLPTYKDVAVVQVNASDPDSSELTTLRYDIIDGNKDHIFSIDSVMGIITVINADNIKPRHKLHVRVSDGKFSSIAQVNIKVEKSENSGLTFQKKVYEGSILENSTKITTVCVVNVVGSTLNEHVMFSILNPTDMFEIGLTSGAIRTTGIRFDREVKDSYELIVQAKSESFDQDKPRVAHVIVNVTILDINDNCPMFVNLPYYAVVSVDDQKGDIITKVHAIDMDSFENGEVRYELIKGHGELFKVNRKTGEIELKQNLEGHNREYSLIIAAYDGGITPCSTEVTVHVKVIDRSMPVFKKQFYTESVPESVELHSTLAVSVEAESPLSRKLIYSIVRGNELEEFALDFNTAPDSNNGPCVISVVDELDYEQQQQYELIVRATDSVSGVYAEVPVSILVQDVNDCPPEFPADNYNVSVSEAASFGTPILKVSTRDNDTGINAQVQYSIKNDLSNSSDFFYIDASDGTIYLKQSLDHEIARTHHFIVIATDMGVPSLSSTAHVWLTVLDMNDNPPKFDQPSYTCELSIHASRGQFVTVLSASDPDIVDQNNLRYTIVAGNELQTFSIDQYSGIVTLLNLANFGEQKSSILNISVSDGVYTSFTKLKVNLLPANLHSPVFPHVLIEAKVPENQSRGRLVATVAATDSDFGEFGAITYSIHSELLNDYFHIDKFNGEITTKIKLDREHQHVYEIPIMATDGGGRSGFMTVRVRITDDNDNTPQFLLREYKASIHSNHTIGSPFLKIRAFDRDEDEAARIQYSIYDKQDSGVTELFAINPTTGGIFLIKNAAKWESQTFQFFVRAKDNGSPISLHSDVPINVLIMAPKDVPPIFERKDDKFFLTENSPTGTVIARLKMVSNVSVIYRIISGSEDNPEFTIDSQGQLSLARPLDFEVQDSHLIGVVAETDGSPPLTALAEVSLQVLDENDHAPQFESTPYIVTIAENIDEGTPIVKVIAHDEDKGSNSEVRYSLDSDVGDTANVFAIDAYTGWISTLVKLDKEQKDEYRFQIVATDNGHPKHSARTTVIVKLKDYNDSPPVFKSSMYEAAVNEDALPGTIVVRLSTIDADVDLNTPINFYITGGESRSHFQIRQTGEVYVAKPLDRETLSRYNLDVLATDGKYTATTKVSIEVLDVNDNPPYCVRYRYRHILSEGVHPGTFILSILATDIDDEENSKLRYYLTGEGADKFSLDPDNGLLKTARALDRETQSKYTLLALVQDREHSQWECSSHVEIVVSDLNDNAPSFSFPSYSVALPEDVEVGTLVTKVHATDADIGINRKVKYTFIDSAKDHFKISTDSGIVTLAKPLDRELRAMYNLTVQAIDQGTPQLSSVATLIVNVQDINDNPPEFAMKYYYATVPEIAAIGSEVVRVLATSKDTGINADVSYSIVGGNEHKKFKIDSKTGVVIIADTLDYERAKDYFLTIQAIDGGDPPLSNLATMNITVIDNNDNAPLFSQTSYSATVREDAEIGDKIKQVTATDLDSGENGRITYSIKRGDRFEQFVIDADTGYISVSGKLDRETTSNYVLEIHARDNGIPQLSSQVNVNIEISDANDNPPVFSQQNYSTIVQEDKPLGYSILKFVVTDADAAPNGAPYTFDFSSGNEGGFFRIEQDGILRTASRFNHKVKENYLLHVRVFDNGSPPLYSDTWVVVKVIEESQYPPVITPLDISVNSYLDEYPGGVIGKVFATDQDQYDTLTYAISPTHGVPFPMTDLFQIDRTDGTLKAYPRVDVGEYRLNVSVTDGKFYAFALVKISVDIITEEMLDHAVVVRFREVTPQDFILSHRKGFIRSVRNALNVRLKDIIIISVQPSSNEKPTHFRNTRDIFLNETSNRYSRQVIANDLDVLFTVRKPQTLPMVISFYSSDSIRKALNENLEELEESTKLVVEEIVRMKCTSSHCMYGECKDRIVINPATISPISTDVTSFVSPKHEQRTECECKEGYGGDRCDTIVNDCAREPCSKFKLCIPDASLQGYTCQCPEGFAGANCDVDISKCHDQSCYIPRNPVSFNGKSYAQYEVKGVDEKLSFSLRIRTLQATGTLMYAAGLVDYNVLEIVNGAVQYRFELGNGEGLVKISTLFISDGHWHEIRLERDGNSARITVDATHSAYGSAPGVSDILNIQDSDIYLGAEVRQHPTIIGFEDIQRGFSGCMDDVRISRVSVPLHKSGASSVALLKRFANVEFSCDAASVLIPMGACSSQPCQNGGTCKETKTGGFECLCYSRFMGPLCELDTDPCASSPCLFGGKCSITPKGNDYQCECIPPRLTGRRCEYGHYCSPNPCRHGGVCEEGDTGPLCKCRSWTGEFCELDLDECETQPCQNGGTCTNEPGSYKCYCPPNMTGTHCTNSVYPPSITVNANETYIIIGVSILVVSVFVLCIACCKRMYSKRNRQRANLNINNDTREKPILNSHTIARPHELTEFKRTSKLSNLEVNQREQAITSSRPASSYIASTNNEPIYNCSPVVFNNLDTLRSYGSAGDELENFPPDYKRNLNRNSHSTNNGMGNHCGSDSDSLHKPTLAERMHLASFNDGTKIKNDLKQTIPLITEPPTRYFGSRSSNGRHLSNGIISQGSSGDEESRTGSYHWDCSDWAPRSQNPLPDITEVPGSEVPDSSSFHSNESNESCCHQLPVLLGSGRNIETLNEDESEELGESECERTTLNVLDGGNDEYRFNTADSYLRHPNTYLPTHGYNIPSESELGHDCTPLHSPSGMSDQEVEPYGFPSNRNRRKLHDDDRVSVITTLEERHSLLGGCASNSDLSTNLCDIEDSECESEVKPLNWMHGVHQTSV